MKYTFVKSTILAACSVLVACGDADTEEQDEAAAWGDAHSELMAGKSDGQLCSGVVTPDRSGFAKRVALTFDDGPNAATTPDVLDTLARHNIKATFFINGNRVGGATQRDILQRIVDEGHILANHTQEHKQLNRVSLAVAEQQVEETNTIIEGFAVPEFFRFPFGASNCDTASLVRDEQGMTITGWDVDSADWCFAGNGGTCPASAFDAVPSAFREDMRGWTLDQVRRKNGGIVLFHDIHRFTADSIEPIISDMENEGFTFTNLDDEITFPLLNGIELPWVGDVCEADEDCKLGDSFDALCEVGADATAGMCTVECEGTCPDRGSASTFCVSLDDGMSGSCVLQAGSSNSNCADLEHLELRTMDRYVANSGASARSDEVCVPR